MKVLLPCDTPHGTHALLNLANLAVIEIKTLKDEVNDRIAIAPLLEQTVGN